MLVENVFTIVFWFQGSFFGFEVSGFDVYSVINSEETGMDLFTGGPFGFEGSILATLLLGGFSLWIILKNPGIFLNDKKEEVRANSASLLGIILS